MQVFKGFFKILLKNINVVIVYFVVFAILTLIIGSTLKKTNNSYEIQKVNVAIKNEDSTEYSKDLLAYLNPYIKEKKLNNLSVDDGLFWDEIDMYIEIPEDFYTKLLEEEENIILIKTTPNSTTAYSLKERITDLFNLTKVNAKHNLSDKNQAMKDAILLLENSEKQMETSLVSSNGDTSIVTSLYGYALYVIFAVVISLIGTIMMAFKSTEIKRRMNISSVSGLKLNTSLIIGNICIGILFSCIIYIMAYFLIGPNIVGKNAIFYLINILIFSFTLVGISYAVAMLVSSQIVMQVLNVVLPLGTAFLSGLFVPMEFLSKEVIGVAHLLPQYYAVCCNQYIASSNTIEFGKYFSYIWPQFIFIFISIVIICLIYRKNRIKES